MRKNLFALILFVVCFAFRIAAGTDSQGAAQTQVPAGKTPASAAPAQPSPQQQATYVGEATCIGCHDAEGTSIHKSMHGRPENPRSPAAKHGCETCHGPGSVHVEDPSQTGSIRRFGTLSPREASDTCLTCHSHGAHVNWKGSMHEERNLSCITCHSVHNAKSDQAQLKTETVIQTCVTCHKMEVAKQQRSGHMPIREGKMTCTSCHDPHGSTNVRMLKVGNYINELCASCHAEKRGPFLWDHAPVREGCNTCHDPHGSNNDRMLVAKLPMLCQRCHIGTKHPSTIYDANQLAKGSSRLIGRGCVNCHQQIHGSNSPAGNAFLR
jgi:DmsE family decaheme c-type cytochrome